MAGRALRRKEPAAAGFGLAGSLLTCLLVTAESSVAQVGPVSVDGFLEYQYRFSEGPGRTDGTSQLGTVRTNVSTYLWQPWIVQVNASLGLTETVSDQGNVEQDGSLVTGGMRVDVFGQSRFPFAAYFDSENSRIDGDLSDLDVLTRTHGFLQQYSDNSGGSYSLEYRHRDVEDLFDGDRLVSREHISDVWQARINRTLGRRNHIVLNSELTDMSRGEPVQQLERMRHTLRHRFRSGSQLFLEDTSFFSSERLEFDDLVRERRFMQFNGVSTWRPRSGKPLLVVARGLLQGIDSDALGIEQDSTNAALTGTVTYQQSDRLYFAANVGVSSADSSETDDQTSVFQQARADYRSSVLDFWDSEYRWGGTAELGNRTGRLNGDDDNSSQDLSLSFHHNLSKRYRLASARDLEFNISQKLTGAFDTHIENHQIVSHSVYATLSRQLGKSRSFIRLSATDRRSFREQRDTFQIVNMQASQTTQATRHRSWTGSLTLQYGRTARSNGHVIPTDDKNVSYSANLTYRHTDLFGVPLLNLHSELRLLSTDFATDDPFNDALDQDITRMDTGWRNRLDYRVGLLQLRLEANMRKVDSMWNSTVFLSVRRYYGMR